MAKIIWTPEQRFVSFIYKSPNGCWYWLGCTNDEGYGSFRVDRKTVLAHRFAYLLWKGPLKDYLKVDHTCDNTSCVNPEHLEEVTNRENVKRSYQRRLDRARLIKLNYIGDNKNAI